MEAHKTSFLSSVLNGIKGAAKGGLAGVAVGALIGAAGGALLGAVGLAAVGGVGLGMGAAAIAGMGFGASVLGSVGATAGTITGVVQSRESAHSAEDIAKVANIAFAQGLAVGHQAQQQQEIAGSDAWRKRIEQERAAQQTQQRLH